MPVLSVDYSRGAATFLYVKDNLSYELIRLPSMMPDIFYAHKPSHKESFELMVADVIAQLKIKPSDKVKIYGSALKDLGIEGKNTKFCNKSDAFKSLYPLDFFYFSHLHVGSNVGIFQEEVNFSELLKELLFDEEEEVIRNYFENLSLYPYVQPSSDRDYYEEEAYLRIISKRHCVIEEKDLFVNQRPITFSTTRKFLAENDLCRFMLLCLDSLCHEGFYTFKLDPKDFIGAASALSYFDTKLFQSLELPDFEMLGSVLNIMDDVICTITTNRKAKQEVNVSRNEVFTLPLDEKESVEIDVVSHRHGTLKRKVYGGKFGLIIDTRDKNTLNNISVEKRKEIIKLWEVKLLEQIRSL